MIVSDEEQDVEAADEESSARRVRPRSRRPAADGVPSRDLVLDAFVQGLIPPSRDGLRLLVGSLAEAFAWDHVLVTRVGQGVPVRVRAQAVWSDGRLGREFEYAPGDSPCGRVLGSGSVISHDGGLREAYPRAGWLRELGAESYLGVPLVSPTRTVVGHLALLHREAAPPGFASSERLRQVARGVAWAMEREVAYPRSERVARLELDEARHSVEQTWLHMCAWCRRIREEHGDWDSVEAFFESRAPIRFSHGICDVCARAQRAG